MWAFQFAMMQSCAAANHWTKFISMQNHYNLLYREEEREMNRYCNATGVGLIPWAPLCRGILARAPDTKTTRSSTDRSQTGYSDVDAKIIERVQEIAKKRGWKMSEVALAWINKRCASPIIGFSSVERIEEACGATGKALTEEEERYLEELYTSRNVEGHS
jgi:aryl-alcohol dehydrogenase-like predicted oxidoreductase